MIVEEKLARWLQAGLALYTAHPLMVEWIFYDASQVGTPSYWLPGRFGDTEQAWLPDEYAGGVLRWGGTTFPILGNTATELTLSGDPTQVDPDADPCYAIVPPAVASLTHLLQKTTIAVSTAFAQVPTVLPAITIRLERDAQADTYLGESVQRKVEDGTEWALYTQAMTGSYLLSLWSINRETTLWLYAWLANYALMSIPMFSAWGLYDVSFAGSDLDPALQYLPERTYTRHFVVTATRMERAIQAQSWPEPAWIERVCAQVMAAYAVVDARLPQPLP